MQAGWGWSAALVVFGGWVSSAAQLIGSVCVCGRLLQAPAALGSDNAGSVLLGSLCICTRSSGPYSVQAPFEGSCHSCMQVCVVCVCSALEAGNLPCVSCGLRCVY